MHNITKTVYNSKKSYYKNKNMEAILAILLGIFAVSTIAIHRNEMIYCVVACFSVVASMIYFNLQSYWMLHRVKQKGFVLISDDSRKRFMILEKYGFPLLLIFLITPFFTIILYSQGFINQNTLQIVLLTLLIMTTVIKAYIIDMIIMFSQEEFCSGTVLCQYKNITRMRIFKKIKLDSCNELIYFEIYKNNKYLGFDKFLEQDYRYLKNMIEQTKN